MPDLTIGDRYLLAEAGAMWAISNWARAITEYAQAFMVATVNGDAESLTRLAQEGIRKVVNEEQDIPSRTERIARVLAKLDIELPDTGMPGQQIDWDALMQDIAGTD